MIFIQTVRFAPFVFFVILQLSEKTKCLSFEVKNDEEIQTYTIKSNVISHVLEDNDENWQSSSKDETIYSDILNSKTAPEGSLRDTKERCSTILCAFLQKHRMTRQTNIANSPLYPQLPTTYPYQQMNNTYPQYINGQKNQTFDNFSNYYPPYSTYPNHTGPIFSPFQRPSPNQPFLNSSNYHNPYNNYSNNFNPANSPSPKHTYPPSPRPPQNKPSVNSRANATYFLPSANNTNPYNINYRPTGYSGNVSYSSYPTSYPSYAGSAYPANSQSPLNQIFGYNKTSSGYFNNLNNTRPFNYSSNIPNNFNSFTNSLSPFNTNPLPYSNSNKYPYTSYPKNNYQGVTYSSAGPYGPQTYNSTLTNFTQRYGQHTTYNSGQNLTYNGFSGNNNNPQTNLATHGMLMNSSHKTYPGNYEFGSNRNFSNNFFGNSNNLTNRYPMGHTTNFTMPLYNQAANFFLNNPNLPSTYNATNVYPYSYNQPTPNRPLNPYNTYVFPYNPPVGPNQFHSFPNNNGQQYDPKHPPERSSYPSY